MSLYGVIGYHVTLSEGHMIANHPIYGGDRLSCGPSCTVGQTIGDFVSVHMRSHHPK